MTNRQIKKLAIIKLKGNWGNSVALTLCIFAIILLVILSGLLVLLIHSHLTGTPFSLKSYLSTPVNIVIASVFSLAAAICLSMIYFVIVRQFIDISKGDDFTEKRNAIHAKPFKLIKLTVLPQLLRLVILLCAAAPGLFAIDFVRRIYAMSLEGTLDFMRLFMFMVSMLAVILSIILIAISSLSLHLLPMVIMLHPNIPLLKAVSLCFKATDAKRLQMLWFYLSFLKFLPLAVFIYPSFIIIPYFAMSDIVFMTNILNEELKNDDFFSVFPKVPSKKELKSET